MKNGQQVRRLASLDRIASAHGARNDEHEAALGVDRPRPPSGAPLAAVVAWCKFQNDRASASHKTAPPTRVSVLP